METEDFVVATTMLLADWVIIINVINQVVLDLAGQAIEEEIGIGKGRNSRIIGSEDAKEELVTMEFNQKC